MSNQNTKKKGLFNKFLDFVEVVGNKLPHPASLFAIFALAVVIISAIAAAAGVKVEFEKFVDGQLVTETVHAVSLLTPDGIRKIFTNIVGNFTSFAPLGTVLVAMLGVGVAEGSGLIGALLKKLVLSTPKRLITAVIVFAGIMSNIASDAGYVVLVPLGAVIFVSFGRHPLAGLAAAFAGVSGGFSANLLFGSTDALLSGLSQPAAQMIDPNYLVTITSNWYFLAASTVLITIVGTIVTEKIIEPRLGEFKGKAKNAVDVDTLTTEEVKGLKYATIGLILFIVAIAALSAPANAPLRNPETGSLLEASAFMGGIVPIIALMFFIPGVAYGFGAGTIKGDKDIANFAGKSMASMGSYIVLSFVSAQFVSFFTWSNLGTILAVKGADFLSAVNMTGLPLLLGFILVAAFINLFIASASAKWAIMAPIFIPMFMRLGLSPELTQVAYRIGDSSTNIISPLMSYFAIVIAFAQNYDEDTGIGTLISTMLPYSLVFLISWAIFFAIWYLIGLPLGPGAGLFYPMS